MPYIKPENRPQFNNIIDETIKLINKDDKLDVGSLNYIVSMIIWKIFDNNPSYKLGNDIIGVIECIKQEFYRRRLSNYEDEKINQNGDII